MTDLEALKDVIDESGLPITVLCKKAGIKTFTLYNRLKGVGEFKVSEILGLQLALKLTDKERDSIFLCPLSLI